LVHLFYVVPGHHGISRKTVCHAFPPIWDAPCPAGPEGAKELHFVGILLIRLRICQTKPSSNRRFINT